MCFFMKKSTVLGCEWCVIFEGTLRPLFNFLILDYSLTCCYRKIRLKFFFPSWVAVDIQIHPINEALESSAR